MLAGDFTEWSSLTAREVIISHLAICLHMYDIISHQGDLNMANWCIVFMWFHLLWSVYARQKQYTEKG